MVLSDLRTMVWGWLDDPNGTYFTQAQIDVWINNAQREVQKQLIEAGENWYVTRASTSTVANSDTYSLPSDFLHLHKLEILLSGTAPNEVRQTLTFQTDVQIDTISMTTGTPGYYAIRRNAFILRPIPDTVKTIYMDYSYLVADMVNASDTPDVPTQYQEYIAILATLDGFVKDQRDPSNILMKKNTYLEMLKSSAENRNLDQPRMIVCLEDAGFGYLF